MANHYIQRYDLSKYTLKSFDSADEICADTHNSDILTYNANGTVATLLSSGANATVTNTNTSATPGTVNGLSVVESTSSSLTSGTLAAIRGLFSLPTGLTMSSGVFAYGVTGRNVINGTVDIGSGDLAAVYAKSDYNGATLTSGHIAPLQANIVNPPASAGTTVDLIYAESASGTPIKSILSGFAAANFAFDLTDVGAVMFPAISSTTLNGVNIKVKLNGSTYYIKTGTAA